MSNEKACNPQELKAVETMEALRANREAEQTAHALEATKGGEKFPVEIGVQFSGERIRTPDTQITLGSDKTTYKFELVNVRGVGEVEDGRVVVEGPDLKEMKEGGTFPLGILVEVAGKQVEKDQEGVIERRIHEITNYIEGVMHLNQRNTIFLRVSKKAFKKGFDSLNWHARILAKLLKAQFPFIEKIQVTYFTEEEKIKDRYGQALAAYRARDDRARALTDEEAPEFYSCLLCQSFAPNNVCIITPERTAPCGATNWFDAKVSCRIDPKGPNSVIVKGECLDPLAGEWEGVNKFTFERSNGTLNRIFLHSMFDQPHTVCGCFEMIAFYIPEVEGMGIVTRDYKDPTVSGLTFSTLANVTGGGVQTPGFLGISLGYLRSKKYLARDGGWDRMVWVPSSLKERLVKEFSEDIPPQALERIATEKEAKNLDELKAFLQNVNHPVLERMKAKAAQAPPAEEEAPKELGRVSEMEFPAEALGIPMAAGGGVRIILKNAKIYADKLIIRRVEKK